jgi:hypothetical protein
MAFVPVGIEGSVQRFYLSRGEEARDVQEALQVVQELLPVVHLHRRPRWRCGRRGGSGEWRRRWSGGHRRRQQQQLGLGLPELGVSEEAALVHFAKRRELPHQRVCRDVAGHRGEPVHGRHGCLAAWPLLLLYNCRRAAQREGGAARAGGARGRRARAAQPCMPPMHAACIAWCLGLENQPKFTFFIEYCNNLLSRGANGPE